MLKEVVQYLLLRRGAAKHNSAPLAPFLRRSKNGDDFIQDANPQRQHKWVLRASETIIAGRPANAGRAYSAGSEIETSAAKKPMQRFLAFIPRKWRLAPWQVLLGAAATFAWWGFMGYSIPAADPLWKDPLLILFIASWVIPAWLVYWLFVIAVRRASANIPLVARALAEIAAFAAMIGVAMLVTYLFPERHFWHGEVSRDAAYSPVVFAATLISEVGMYISWRVLGAVTQANKPGPCSGDDLKKWGEPPR